MRLVTYNVLAFGAKPWMRPWQGRYLRDHGRLDEIQNVLQGLQPTLVGMQEIWNPGLFEDLGISLRMKAVTAQSQYPARCGLLSSVPILRFRTIWFKDSPGAWGRSFLEAEVLMEGKRYSVFVIHLPVHSTAMLYSRSLQAALSNRYAEEAILLGDFNCPPQFGVPRTLARQSFHDVLSSADIEPALRKSTLVGPMKLWSKLNAKSIQSGHIDYIFIPDSMSHAVQEGGFVQNKSTDRISDHVPAFAFLDKALL